jgi:molybdopterin converting factor small subunit
MALYFHPAVPANSCHQNDECHDLSYGYRIERRLAMFDSPVVSVHIPLTLRQFSGGRNEVTASGDTVGEILEAVGHEYPAIRSHLISPDGGLQPAATVFLGSRSIGELQGLATPVELAESLSIVAPAS